MRTTIFNLPVDILSHEETVRSAIDAMEKGQRRQHVALNVAKLVMARTDPELEQNIRASDIVGIDGMGIVYALRLLGYDVPERVAGADLFDSLMAECARRQLRPFLLGASPTVLEEAVRRLQRRHAGLRFAGTHHGYFPSEREEEVCSVIRASGAHCLFVAMPTPRKERFVNRFRDRMSVPFIMGIGGTLDVTAGQVRRAPVLVQKVGLEWAFRMVQEPRRLAWRYLRTNSVFAALLLRQLVSRWAGSAARS